MLKIAVLCEQAPTTTLGPVVRRGTNLQELPTAFSGTPSSWKGVHTYIGSAELKNHVIAAIKILCMGVR